MNKSPVIFSLLFVSFFAPASLIAKTYLWTDEQGNTFYSDQQPQSVQNLKEVAPPPPAAVPQDEAMQKLEQQTEQLNQSSEKRRQDKEETARLKENDRLKKQNCAYARSNLDLLINRPARTRFQIGDGEYKQLSREERDAQVKQANEDIEKYCR